MCKADGNTATSTSDDKVRSRRPSASSATLAQVPCIFQLPATMGRRMLYLVDQSGRRCYPTLPILARESGTYLCNDSCQLLGTGSHLQLVIALNHHSQQRLGARLAQQHPPTPSHALSNLGAGRLDFGMLQRIQRAGKPHIDQHLRTLTQATARLCKCHLATTQGE